MLYTKTKWNSRRLRCCRRVERNQLKNIQKKSAKKSTFIYGTCIYGLKYIYIYIWLYAYVNYHCFFFFIGRPKMSNVFGDKRTKLNEVIQSKVWSIHVFFYIYIYRYRGSKIEISNELLIAIGLKKVKPRKRHRSSRKTSLFGWPFDRNRLTAFWASTFWG